MRRFMQYFHAEIGRLFLIRRRFFCHTMAMNRNPALLWIIAFACAAGAQDNTDQLLLKLIDDLGSYSPETREKAESELLAAGEKAIPLLKKRMAETDDDEIRLRGERLVKWIGKRDVVSANLVKKVPDILDRLLSDDPVDKSNLLVAITGERPPIEMVNENPRASPLDYRDIAYDDLVKVLIDIAREMKTVPLKRHLLHVVKNRMMMEIAPYLTRLISAKEDEQVCREAMIIVGAIIEKSAIPAAKALKAESKNPELVEFATFLLARLGDKTQEESLVVLLRSENHEHQMHAIIGLGTIGAKAHIGKIREFLTSDNADLALHAIDALRMLDDKESITAIVAFARKEAEKSKGDLDIQGNFFDSPDYRAIHALNSVARLGRDAEAKDHPEALKTLKEIALARKKTFIPCAAAEALIAFGCEEGVERLLSSSMPFTATGGMNRFYNPEKYRRLSKRDDGIEGPFQYRNCAELVEILQRKSGMKVEGRENLSPSARPFLLLGRDERASVIDFLDALQTYHVSYIIQGETIRIVPLEQARAFFTKWWSDTKRERQGKKEKEY